MRGHPLGAEPFRQLPRHPLGEAPGIDEDQGQCDRLRSARPASRRTCCRTSPDITASSGEDLEGKVARPAIAGVDDPALRSGPTRNRPPPRSAFCVAERPTRSKAAAQRRPAGWSEDGQMWSRATARASTTSTSTVPRPSRRAFCSRSEPAESAIPAWSRRCAAATAACAPVPWRM